MHSDRERIILEGDLASCAGRLTIDHFELEEELGHRLGVSRNQYGGMLAGQLGRVRLTLEPHGRRHDSG